MKYSLILIFLFNISFANSLQEPSSLNHFINDDGWILIDEYDDNLRLYEKNLQKLSVKAYRVEKTTDIDSRTLYHAFENIKDYENILTSASNIHFDFICENLDTLYGYQYINIPLVNDRHYVYRLVKSSTSRPYSYWTLVNDNLLPETNVSNRDKDAVALTRGSGLYRVINNGTEQTAQYNLYLDPAGKIPSFLTNIANRQGLVNMFRDLLQHSEKSD